MPTARAGYRDNAPVYPETFTEMGYCIAGIVAGPADPCTGWCRNVPGLTGVRMVSDALPPLGPSVLQDGWSGCQFQGISSSMRFCGQPLTRRVSRSAK